MLFLDVYVFLECLPQQGRNNVSHAMVRTLPGCRLHFCGVPNNAEGWLIGDYIYFLEVVDIAILKYFLVMLRYQIDEAVYCTGTLVLIQPQLEVHIH